MTAQISSNNALPQDQTISILYYPGRRPITIGQVGHTALEIEGTSTHYGLFKKKTLPEFKKINDLISSANKGGAVFFRVHFKVTKEQISQLQKTVQEKTFQFTCTHSTSKALKKIGITIPPPLNIFPLTAFIYLCISKKVFKNRNITKIEQYGSFTKNRNVLASMNGLCCETLLVTFPLVLLISIFKIANKQFKQT